MPGDIRQGKKRPKANPKKTRIQKGNPMAKPRKRDFAVSLFPFLSILACVLGVLTLMITSVVLTQIDDESVEQAKEEVLNKNSEEIQSLEEKIEREKKWLAPLRKDVILAREISPLADQLRNLQSQKTPKALTDAEMKAEIAKMQAANRKLQQQTQSDKAKAAQKQEQLDVKSNPAGYATVNVRRSQSALGDTITPIFVECSKEGLSVFDGKGNLDYKVPLAQITKHTQLKQLVKQTAGKSQVRAWKSLAGTQIKAAFIERKGIYVVLKEPSGKVHSKIKPESLTPKSRQAISELEKLKKAGKRPTAGHYVIFLVRPEGVTSWAKGRELCLGVNCQNGKLPIPSKGEINVKAFLN